MGSNIDDYSNLQTTINDSHSHNNTTDFNNSLEYIIFDLKGHLDIYEQKDKNISNSLDNLECSINYIMDGCDKVLLRNYFHDNDIIPFRGVGEEPILVSLNHTSDSLHINDQIIDMHRTKLLLDNFTDKNQHFLSNIQRKTDVEKIKFKFNEENICDQEARRALFKVKLECYTNKINDLNDVIGSLDKPKYNLEEMRQLKKEDHSQKEKLAMTKVQLVKYEGLSPHLKDAKKALDQIIVDLKCVEIELRKKLNL